MICVMPVPSSLLSTAHAPDHHHQSLVSPYPSCPDLCSGIPINTSPPQFVTSRSLPAPMREDLLWVSATFNIVCLLCLSSECPLPRHPRLCPPAFLPPPLQRLHHHPASLRPNSRSPGYPHIPVVLDPASRVPPRPQPRAADAMTPRRSEGRSRRAGERGSETGPAAAVHRGRWTWVRRDRGASGSPTGSG